MKNYEQLPINTTLELLRLTMQKVANRSDSNVKRIRPVLLHFRLQARVLNTALISGSNVTEEVDALEQLFMRTLKENGIEL